MLVLLGVCFVSKVLFTRDIKKIRCLYILIYILIWHFIVLVQLNMLTILILVSSSVMSVIFIGVNQHLPSNIFKVLTTELFRTWRCISLCLFNQCVTISHSFFINYFDMCLYIVCSEPFWAVYFEIKNFKLRKSAEQQKPKQKGGIISFTPEG